MSWKRGAQLDRATLLLGQWHWSPAHAPGAYRLHMPVELNSWILRTLCNIIRSNGVNFYQLFLRCLADLYCLIIICIFQAIGYGSLTLAAKSIQFPRKIRFIDLVYFTESNELKVFSWNSVMYITVTWNYILIY